MCWINGFIKQTNKSEGEQLVNSMSQSIIHRGPDDQWFFCQSLKNWLLAQGQVRLAIVDLSDAGFQPMFYDKKNGCFSTKHQSQLLEKLWEKSLRIVFNGEIYNYQEIKEELVQKWYKFSSNSDTEVILASYLERWQDCVSRFNGMWAFALYDLVKEELFCSRDRLGKKPFYYYFDGKSFIFSSEIKGILEHKELHINTKENISSEALDFYFTMGYIPAPWTIYKNVQKLEARYNLTIKTIWNNELSLRKDCYYAIPKCTPINNRTQLLEEWKKLMTETVKDRMICDVAIWANLSGGLDSSSVVGEMLKQTDAKNLHTFSIWFEWKYDESNYIHIVEKAFWTKHHHEYFKQEDFEKMIEDISYYYDEPFADYSSFPTTFVSQLAKKYVSVVLTGDGGDEIFWWYMMHQVWAQMTIIKKIPKFLRRIAYFILPYTSNNLSLVSKFKEALRVSFFPDEEFYANIGWSSIYKPEVYKKWTKEKFSEILKATNWNFTQAIIDFDLFYNTMADNFLVKTDRASMAQPVEYRSPFCDIRWVEWGRKCPVKWKVNRRKTKILMREIIKDLVPCEILNRWKQWFEPPLKEWVLEEKHMKTIFEWFEELVDVWVFTSQWKSFYENEVFKKNNSVFNVYKIRLFLLIKWYEKWVKN